MSKQSIITTVVIPDASCSGLTLYALQLYCLEHGATAIIDGDMGTARVYPSDKDTSVITVTIL